MGGCVTFGCAIVGAGAIAEIWIDNHSLATSVFHASLIGAGAVLFLCLAGIRIRKLGINRQGFAATVFTLCGLAACTGAAFHVFDYAPIDGLPDMILLGAASVALMAVFMFVSSNNEGGDMLTRIANVCVYMGGLTVLVTTGILVANTCEHGLTLPSPWVYIGVGGFVGLMPLLGIVFRTLPLCLKKINIVNND